MTDHPTTEYPSRFVGWFGTFGDDTTADGFVIMLAGTIDQAGNMMDDGFNARWDFVTPWSEFVKWDISRVVGTARIYSTGNDETAWKRGETIRTVADLLTACNA